MKFNVEKIKYLCITHFKINNFFFFFFDQILTHEFNMILINEDCT